MNQRHPAGPVGQARRRQPRAIVELNLDAGHLDVVRRGAGDGAQWAVDLLVPSGARDNNLRPHVIAHGHRANGRASLSVHPLELDDVEVVSSVWVDGRIARGRRRQLGRPASRAADDAPGPGGGGQVGHIQVADGSDAGDGQINHRIVRQGGIALTNGVIAAIGHIDKAVSIDRQPFGAIKPGLAPQPVGIAGGADLATDGSHHAAGSDFADRLVTGVPDVKIARRIYGDAEGISEPGGRVRAVVAAAATAEPGQGRHRSIRRHLADTTITVIGHIDVITGIDCDILRVVETSGAPHPVVGA